MAEMEEALRSCMEQLVMAREEREQIIVEAANEISSEKKKVRELQRWLDDASKKVAKLTAEKTRLCNSVNAKDALVGELRDSEAAARGKLADALARLESAQKQASSLQYEVRMLQKELEVRREEREYDLKAADAARRQQAEHLNRIAQLEAECQRLRAMVRKRLPGPAAIAKMRDEVDHQHQQLTPRSSPRRPRPATPSSPRSVESSFIMRTPSPRRSVAEAENYVLKLRAVEDENRALKQALAKRESELQFVQMKYADEACKLTEVQRQLKELTAENKQLSAAHCQSESWASALMSELEQFKSGNQNGASIMESDMRVLDDFAEIEKMEAAAGDRKKNSPRASPKKADVASVTQEENGKYFAVNGSIPSGHPEKVEDNWELVMHKHESSGESVDAILEEIRHALDQKTISTKREDSDVSYNRSQVEKVVKNLIVELAPVINASAEDHIARSIPLVPDNSELFSRLENLLQVCHDFLHGEVNLEKFIDEGCQILKYTLSQYFSNQDHSYTINSYTKDSDEGKLLTAISEEGQHSKDTHGGGAKPAAALEIQQEGQDEPIQSAEDKVLTSDQEKLDKEWVLGPNDDILPGRKSANCETESPAAEASVKERAEEERLASNSDIQAAADKLAECQQAITIINKQLQALRTPATHKPQSLGSILAEELANANGSRSPTASKQAQFDGEQGTSCATPSAAQEQNASAEDEDSMQIVVHPVFAEPRQDDVSADPGRKKKRGPSLLGRMFRKKAEGSS